jgi:hypothetical protein
VEVQQLPAQTVLPNPLAPMYVTAPTNMLDPMYVQPPPPPAYPPPAKEEKKEARPSHVVDWSVERTVCASLLPFFPS